MYLKVSYICHRAINSKANRLHIRCRITSTSFQSITTFIYLEVQILTAFLFHSLHYVALRITLTSITCLPLQGLSTVNSVCPLSSHDSSSLNSNSPSQQYKTDSLTTLLWNYPMVCHLQAFSW